MPDASTMSPSSFQVGPDTVVHFVYKLLDEEGELVEEADPALPIAFLFGYGQVSPALERALDGMAQGQTREVTLHPSDAFGERRKEAILELARDEFPEELEVGQEFEADTEDGDSLALLVLELQDDVVIVDTNHPLAGQQVTLVVSVEGVRPATGAEVAQAEEELSMNESSAQSLLPSSSLVRRPPENP